MAHVSSLGSAITTQILWRQFRICLICYDLYDLYDLYDRDLSEAWKVVCRIMFRLNRARAGLLPKASAGNLWADYPVKTGDTSPFLNTPLRHPLPTSDPRKSLLTCSTTVLCIADMNSVNLIPGTEHMLNKVDGWTGLQKGIKCVPVCRVCVPSHGTWTRLEPTIVL